MGFHYSCSDVTAYLRVHIPRLSVALQISDLDQVEASKEARVCVCTLESERNDEAVRDSFFEKAAGISSKHVIHPAKPRTVGRQQHLANVEAENPSQYWKRPVYVPCLDHLTTELTEKLVDPYLGFQAQYPIPTKIQGAPQDLITRWISGSPQFFPGTYCALKSLLKYPASVCTA